MLLTNFKSNLSFSGDPAGNLMRTLNGDINFNTGNGKYQGVDLLHELSSIAKFSQSTPAQGFTNIVKLAGLINIKNGVAPDFNMVPFKDKLKDDEIWNVVNYLRSIAKK